MLVISIIMIRLLLGYVVFWSFALDRNNLIDLKTFRKKRLCGVSRGQGIGPRALHCFASLAPFEQCIGTRGCTHISWLSLYPFLYVAIAKNTFEWTIYLDFCGTKFCTFGQVCVGVCGKLWPPANLIRWIWLCIYFNFKSIQNALGIG